MMTEFRGGLGVIQGFLRVSHDHSVAVHGKRCVLHHIILEHKNKMYNHIMLYGKTTILFLSFLESIKDNYGAREHES